jgi:hypothetical protein
MKRHNNATYIISITILIVFIRNVPVELFYSALDFIARTEATDG